MSDVDKPSWWRSATPPLNWPTSGGKPRGRITLPDHLSWSGPTSTFDLDDLDYFGPSRDAVDLLWPVIRDRLLSAGLTVDVHQSDHGFAKMSVPDLATGKTTQVDVGFDPAAHASITMPMGSVRALDDLAGDKLLALFGRAAPRDFVDVHALREHFTRQTLESLAGAKDLGFNLAVLRDAFGVLDDLPRSAFEVDDVTFALLRAEFQSWREEIGDGP